MLATIGWGRGEAASHWGQAPFFDIRFNEHEPHLSKINMNAAGAVGPDCWEEILTAVVVSHILQLLAISSEEDRARPGAVSNTDHVALEEWGTVW